MPFVQSEDLQEKLQEKGIKNKLVVIKGKKHGNFSAEEYAFAFEEIRKFFK